MILVNVCKHISGLWVGGCSGYRAKWASKNGCRFAEWYVGLFSQQNCPISSNSVVIKMKFHEWQNVSKVLFKKFDFWSWHTKMNLHLYQCNFTNYHVQVVPSVTLWTVDVCALVSSVDCGCLCTRELSHVRLCLYVYHSWHFLISWHLHENKSTLLDVAWIVYHRWDWARIHVESMLSPTSTPIF